jgi:FkbM family methyltransferase
MSYLARFIDQYRSSRKTKLAQTIAAKNNLKVAYEIDSDDASVIIDIYLKRVYNTCFPFYEDAVIVDIGAHRGFFSIFCDTYTGGKSTIYALEPEPSNFRKLTDNLGINHCTKVLPHNIAVSGETGTQQLYISKSVNHSLIRLQEDHPYIDQDTSITIQTTSLLDFIKKENLSRIDFLKIDCEGCEYEMLLNSDSSCFDYISTISMEFHDIHSPEYNVHKLVTHLKRHGYEIVRYEFQETPLPLQMGILVMSKAGH